MEKSRARMTNDLDELAMEYERVNNYLHCLTDFLKIIIFTV